MNGCKLKATFLATLIETKGILLKFLLTITIRVLLTSANGNTSKASSIEPTTNGIRWYRIAATGANFLKYNCFSVEFVFKFALNI